MASDSVELLSAASLTKARRFATPSRDFRFKTKAVWEVGEKAPLVKKRSASLSLTPMAKRYLRFKILRSVGDFSRKASFNEFETSVVARPIPAAPPTGSVAREKVAPPAKAALATPFSSCWSTGLLL